MTVPSTPADQTVSAKQRTVKISGVRVHNLKNLDIEVPLDQIVCLVGVSGSGKSSLAFDTLHVEGQRRFFETLSASSRQFVSSLERPNVDRVDNLPPTVALKQTDQILDGSQSVGDVVELTRIFRGIADHVGARICPHCDSTTILESVSTIAEFLQTFASGDKLQIGFQSHPIGKEPANLHQYRLEQAGFQRFDQQPDDSFLVIVDRILAGRASAERLTESIETAVQMGERSCFLLSESRPDYDPPNDRTPSSPVEIGGRSWFRTSFFLDGRCSVCGQDMPDISDDSHVTLGNRNLSEWFAMPLVESDCDWHSAVHATGNAHRQLVADLVLRAEATLQLLKKVGLGHLPLARKIADVSSGELRRLNLVRTLSLGLVDALYILDEPASHLHPQDVQQLKDVVREIPARENSVVMIEHDSQLVELADAVMEIGPGAGDLGGEVTFTGSPADYLARSAPKGASSFSNKSEEGARNPKTDRAIRLKGVRTNNLMNIDVEFPLSCLCVVTGVSGSGKSSLVSQTLHPAVSNRLSNSRAVVQATSANFDSLTGVNGIDEVLLVHSSLDVKNPRSCPATFLKLWDEIRNVFANTHDAKANNITTRDLSFHVADGARCRRCKGAGVVALEMHFLDKLEMTCPDCEGSRFEQRVLGLKYRGKSIADVLRMSADEAFQFFRSQPKLQRKLQPLREVGLGYLTIGRSTKTLSGGEAERLKLASVLGAGTGKRILFLFDEPTAGLHPDNISQLLTTFRHLVEVGHSVIATTHSLQLISQADHVIDLGPGAGDAGGTVISTGSPGSIARHVDSLTGRWLKNSKYLPN